MLKGATSHPYHDGVLHFPTRFYVYAVSSDTCCLPLTTSVLL